ncbi:MAG: 4Fe-4S binding protein [Clostridiales bacterium]|nr:4Fe-4S binding protein [Clostridiales bacterium]
MDRQEIFQVLKVFLDTDPSNRITEEAARRPEYAGVRLFDNPLVGCAAADDEIIRSLERNEAAGLDLRQPEEWLPGAKAVVSFFLPFTEDVRKSNRAAGAPSDLWQQGRVTGQICVECVTNALLSALRNSGYEAMAPLFDPSMKTFKGRAGSENTAYGSNWSERHVAYAAGLGTFGLSKGLITEKGVAGRFGSVVTTLAFTPAPRPYKGLYEYCVRCGACARNCPGDAISLKTGKDHALCDAYLESTRSEDGIWYGCGKCQCGTPCEDRIPGVAQGDV